MSSREQQDKTMWQTVTLDFCFASQTPSLSERVREPDADILRVNLLLLKALRERFSSVSPFER